ncbi:glycosyltransferase family 2 protein [Pseudorhizobium sp. NPDC055634]
MSDASQQPDVTFVIAAYNAEQTLPRAIESALSQVSVDVEVVVVDDCSTDGTLEAARAFNDPRVRVIRQASNGGPGRARNIGIATATGKWIAVLDADDAVLPRRSIAMIERAAASSAEVVVDNLEVVPPGEGQAYRMFEDGALSLRREITLTDYIDSNVIFRETFNFGYMKPIYLREFIQRHDLRFDESLRIGEDYIMMASALASGGRCAVEPSVGYVYYLMQGSISRVLELHHVDSMLAADQAFLDRFPLKGSALAAQYRRTHSLMEARAFLVLVQAIKRRSPAGIIRTAVAHPAALRHLRMPIAVRLRRLLSRSSVWQRRAGSRKGGVRQAG